MRQTPAPTRPTFDLVGVGSPIMDLVAPVPESFLSNIAGQKGGMMLVDDAEISRIIGLLDSEPARATGGSAANATFNAARLGLSATFVGKLGSDAVAEAYIASYRASGVDPGRFKRGSAPNARCLALVTPDAQRTMRTCLGAAMTLAPEEITPADFEGCRHAHVEGYLVFNEALCDKVLASARAAGCSVSLDLSSFEVVHACREWLFRQFQRGIDIVFANEDEIRALFPDSRAAYPEMTRRLASYGVTAAVKLGADGAWIGRDNDLHRIEPVRVGDVKDTNGAGDAWAADSLYGHLTGWDLPSSGDLASFIGAETVRHMGPLVPEHHWLDVKRRAPGFGRV